MTIGRPLKFQTKEQLETLIESYFEDCKQNTKPFTITGLAIWLDTTRQTLLEYEGEVEGREEKSKDFAYTIKRAKQRCENWVEEGALSNKVNPTSAIFNLKNNYGWKDKNETDITSDGKAITWNEQRTYLDETIPKTNTGS